MHLRGNIILPAAFLLAASFLLATECDALPAYSQPNAYNEMEMDPESEAFNELLARLARTLYAKQENNVKRGLDLGLGRGYSGSLTAKHLMGLATANYAGGPGRRRRSVPYYEEA